MAGVIQKATYTFQNGAATSLEIGGSDEANRGEANRDEATYTANRDEAYRDEGNRDTKREARREP